MAEMAPIAAGRCPFCALPAEIMAVVCAFSAARIIRRLVACACSCHAVELRAIILPAVKGWAAAGRSRNATAAGAWRLRWICSRAERLNPPVVRSFETAAARRGDEDALRWAFAAAVAPSEYASALRVAHTLTAACGAGMRRAAVYLANVLRATEEGRDRLLAQRMDILYAAVAGGDSLLASWVAEVCAVEPGWWRSQFGHNCLAIAAHRGVSMLHWVMHCIRTSPGNDSATGVNMTIANCWLRASPEVVALMTLHLDLRLTDLGSWCLTKLSDPVKIKILEHNWRLSDRMKAIPESYKDWLIHLVCSDTPVSSIVRYAKVEVDYFLAHECILLRSLIECAPLERLKHLVALLNPPRGACVHCESLVFASLLRRADPQCYCWFTGRFDITTPIKDLLRIAGRDELNRGGTGSISPAFLEWLVLVRHRVADLPAASRDWQAFVGLMALSPADEAERVRLAACVLGDDPAGDNGRTHSPRLVARICVVSPPVCAAILRARYTRHAGVCAALVKAEARIAAEDQLAATNAQKLLQRCERS